MHLFMAREAVDKHLGVAGAMIDPRTTLAQKLAALPKIMLFYMGWYPVLWFQELLTPFRYGKFGRFAPHLRFIERGCRKLARESFHGMMLYQAKMERKQGFLFRCVDVVMELFAMAASISHAQQLLDENQPDAKPAADMADLFCRNAQRKVRRLFNDLWSNDDALKNRLTANVMQGQHTWLAKGTLPIGLGPEDFEARLFSEGHDATAVDEHQSIAMPTV
jgi:hypothetical protein